MWAILIHWMGVSLLRIMGIDPGSQVLGFGVVDSDSGEKIKHIKHGTLEPPSKMPFVQRLHWIGQGLRQELQKTQPDVVVIEKIFLGKNVQSIFQLGQLRGVILYEVAAVNITIHEYTPREVKLGVAGSGAASKEAVNQVLKALLNLQSIEPLDSSDALALSYHHARKNAAQKMVQWMEQV